MVDTYEGGRIYKEDAYEFMGELFADFSALNDYAADMAGSGLLLAYAGQYRGELGTYICRNFELLEKHIESKVSAKDFIKVLLRGFAKTDSTFFDFADVWTAEHF